MGIQYGLYFKLRGVKIGEEFGCVNVYIDELHPEAVYIEKHSTIGIGSMIITHLYWGPSGRIIRESDNEDDVFVGPNCIILPDVVVEFGYSGRHCCFARYHQEHCLVHKSRSFGKSDIPLTHNYSYENSRRFKPLASPFPIARTCDLFGCILEKRGKPVTFASMMENDQKKW